MDDIESKIPVVNGNDLSVASAMSNGQDPQQFLTIAMLVLFVAFIVLELIKPFGKINKKAYGSSFLTNTTAFIFNNIILSLLSASSLFLIAQNYSYLGLLGRMDESFVKFLISFLLFDLSIYIYHYCSHHNEFLWRFHKIHHSDKSFNVTTGFRFHIFDNIIELLYKSIVIVVLGLNA
nr:sterol desaturase family protein [Gammaproteobacteria bacterium]